MAEPFKFELVTPEKLLVSGAVEQVLVPGAEGDMTILANHARVITTLRPGVLEIDFPDGKKLHFFARGGFAEVVPQGLTVLAEVAIDLDELKPGDLNATIKDAEEDVADLDGDAKDRALLHLEHLRQVEAALNL